MNVSFDHYRITHFDPTEVEAFFTLVNENRARLEDYFAGLTSQTKTLADATLFCQSIAQKVADKTYFPFAIKDTTQEGIIGWIDIKNLDWRIPKAEVGYFIDHRYEGKGIISKAVGYVIEEMIAQHHFKKLLCRANEKNTGSIQVALKNSFELEGTVRRDYRTTSNELVDLNYYGRIFG